MDKIQNVRMLISVATGSKETLTAWVNPKSQNAKRNHLTSKKQPQNQQRMSSKRISDSKKPLRAKRRKVEETTATTSQQSVRAYYTPGDLGAV